MRVDLQNLIDNLQLDKKALAKVLFPKSLHPDLALSRLMTKRSKMDEQQVYVLATYTGMSVDSLYKPAMYWKHEVMNNRVRFTNGDYTALYDPATGITKILLLNKQIALHTLSGNMQPLSEYLQQLNQIILTQQIQEP